MKAIGIIHSPFKTIENMPIQPKGAQDVVGSVEVYPDFAEGLKDLEGFSHIYLIFQLHKAKQGRLIVTPFMDKTPRGVFSTRSPARPNPIGLSIVELVKREGHVLTIKGLDILDGTPLWDIKPYIHSFDAVKNSRSGWMTASVDEVKKKRSDDRFIE